MLSEFVCCPEIQTISFWLNKKEFLESSFYVFLKGKYFIGKMKVGRKSVSSCLGIRVLLNNLPTHSGYKSCGIMCVPN